MEQRVQETPLLETLGLKPKFLGQVQSVNRRAPSSRSRTGFPGSPLAWSQTTLSTSADATLFPGGSKQLCREQWVCLSPKGQCWEVGEGRGGAFSSYGVHLAHKVWKPTLRGTLAVPGLLLQKQRLLSGLV